MQTVLRPSTLLVPPSNISTTYFYLLDYLRIHKSGDDYPVEHARQRPIDCDRHGSELPITQSAHVLIQRWDKNVLWRSNLHKYFMKRNQGFTLWKF